MNKVYNMNKCLRELLIKKLNYKNIKIGEKFEIDKLGIVVYENKSLYIEELEIDYNTINYLDSKILEAIVYNEFKKLKQMKKISLIYALLLIQKKKKVFIDIDFVYDEVLCIDLEEIDIGNDVIRINCKNTNCCIPADDLPKYNFYVKE